MRATVAAFCLLVVALTLAACGSDSGSTGSTAGTSSSSTEGSTSTTAESGGAYLAKIEKEVEGFKSGESFGEPTESSPAAKDKNLYIIECGAQIPTCSFPAEEAEAAAKELGWKTTLIDGKFATANFAPAIETAIAGGADAIMLVSIDCQFVKPQLEKARQAGIVIGAMYAIDCEGDPQYDAPMVIGNDREWGTQLSKYEADRMKVIIAETEAKAKVILFKQDDLVTTKIIGEAGEQELETCAECELTEKVVIATSDTPNVIQQKTQSALSTNSEANSLYPLYNGMVLNGVAAGVQASGRASEVFLMGADGFPEDIELVRKGKQNAVLVFPAGWTAWAVIDGINRKFDGMEPQDSGISWELVDKENNLPPAGQPWEPPVEYKSVYEKLWGLG